MDAGTTPFVLLGRKRLPPEQEPSADHQYDEKLQIWIDRVSGDPLVTTVQRAVEPSPYGETKMTETREGRDQSEIASIQTSRFGETSFTKTVESADQESAEQFQRPGLQSSPYGETQTTATLEGVDQPDVAAFEITSFGETTFTRTSEGHDQTEMDHPTGERAGLPSQQVRRS